MNDNFRTLAFALRNVSGLDTYAVLNAADAVERTVEGLVAQGIRDAESERYEAERAQRAEQSAKDQKVLNAAATTLPGALTFFNELNEIAAIREVRLAFGAGLKAAKDAVESDEFAQAARVHAQRVRDSRDLAQLRHDREWADYNDAVANWCCDEDSGPYPTEPLALWERELLSGN